MNTLVLTLLATRPVPIIVESHQLTPDCIAESVLLNVILLFLELAAREISKIFDTSGLKLFNRQNIFFAEGDGCNKKTLDINRVCIYFIKIYFLLMRYPSTIWCPISGKPVPHL